MTFSLIGSYDFLLPFLGWLPFDVYNLFKLKAQLSFFDTFCPSDCRWLSVRLPVYLSVWKVFTFSTSSTILTKLGTIHNWVMEDRRLLRLRAWLSIKGRLLLRINDNLLVFLKTLAKTTWPEKLKKQVLFLGWDKNGAGEERSKFYI